MDDLNNLKGIGPTTLKNLNKLGIFSIKDLLTYYPFRYDIIKRSNLDLEDQDAKVVIDGLIETIPNIFHFNRKMNKMSFKLNTGSKLLNVTIFNRAFLKQKLSIGTKITVIGKYDKKHNLVVASELRFGLITSISIEPVYHLIYSVSRKQISNYIKNALVLDYDIDDYIPDYLKEKYNFLDKNQSIKIIHNPINLELLKKARLRLKYEELFLFMLKMNYLKNNKDKKIGLKRNVDYKLVEDFISKLDFKLTSDQEKCVKDIFHDLNDPLRMNRLLQGDVGSGKTIVAIISLYINYLSGYQGALMVPTEILANQHFLNIEKIFKNYNINVKLLTGKTKSKDKKMINEGLENGDIDIIVGTHSLISDDVKYNNLGLVITDEQHRFGVNQRANLKNKGITPDILYMSATPIPRTYALTLYGDMEISNIKTMPSGRKDVITFIKSEKEIKDVLILMNNELMKKHQIYVIAPLVLESDKISLENVDALYEKMNKAFGKVYKIGVVHGKMTSKEKDEVMEKFKNNEINILISTTVIEVGIDVRNATMMVIFDSFRFGLSTIHQLRGRVGRSDLQSYCILISNRKTERLEILTKTNDGFKISEEDFKLRGSGDLFGIKQSGDMSFSIADIKHDYNILLKAKEDSIDFLNNNLLEKNLLLKNIIESSSNLD